MDREHDIPAADEWGENESGRYTPDDMAILEELYVQERMANDLLIQQLKGLTKAEPSQAVDGIRKILEDGYMYFGEPRAWRDSKQLELDLEDFERD